MSSEKPRVRDPLAEPEAALEEVRAHTRDNPVRLACETCDGHGAVRAYGPIDDHAVCPDCNGTGRA